MMVTLTVLLSLTTYGSNDCVMVVTTANGSDGYNDSDDCERPLTMFDQKIGRTNEIEKMIIRKLIRRYA